MKRITFDKIVTFVGFGLGVFLLIAAGLLNWGATFASGTVVSQLEAQQITIPAIAAIVAKVTFGGAIFMFLFVILGIRHIRRTPLDATI